MLFRGDITHFIELRDRLDWATVTSDSRNVVIEFKSETGFRQFFELLGGVDDNVWIRAAETWKLRAVFGNKLGHLRPRLSIPYSDVPYVLEGLRTITAGKTSGHHTVPNGSPRQN